MSARHRQEERPQTLKLDKLADWSGALSRTSDGITGHLVCSMTGWRLKLTGTSGGKGIVHLTGQFDSPVISDDAAPWIDEHEMIKPHELQAGGYDCFWTGTTTAAGDSWAGELADRYGGRLALTGKTQREGVVSLRAVARSIEEVRR